jgi:hypothetical protein
MATVDYFVRVGRISVPVSEVLENGDIFFFYRPKLQVDVVRGLDDVQRFYMVIKPAHKSVFRRVILGRKRLPDVGEHERTWGFVDLVTSKAEEIEDEFDPKRYLTKTRGERLEQPARPAGEGIYDIVRHNSHTHLAYALELPQKPGPVQGELNIREAASLIVTVKNPEADSPPRAGLPEYRKPDYPKELKQKFEGKRFVDLDPPELLDYPGTELVLVGARPDPTNELGIALRPKRESLGSADIFRKLKLEKDMHPLAPLTVGEWA